MSCEHINLEAKTNIFRPKVGKHILEIYAVCNDCEMHFRIDSLPRYVQLVESDEHSQVSLLREIKNVC